MGEQETGNKAAERLARALSIEPDDEFCDRVVDRLDDYVEAQMVGEEGDAEVALHLDGCLDCAHLYAQLYDLEFAASKEMLPQTETPPPPSFSWLREAMAPSIQEWLQGAITREVGQLRLLLSGDLVRLLRPAPVPARRGEGGRYQERLLLLDPAEHPALALPLSLTVFIDRDAPNLTLVEIRVQPPGRGWPDLDGMVVRLRASGVSWSSETDPWGIVTFADVPRAVIPELQIVVRLSSAG